MTAELFDTPESLSPRLAWMKKYECLTYHAFTEEGEDPLWLADFDCHDYHYENAADYFQQETAHHGESRIGIGKTEHDAIADLAQKTRTLLWNEENP